MTMSGPRRRTNYSSNSSMGGSSSWTSPWYCGYVWVTVCLLLLCLPPSFPAIVFPNDVLSSLDKYKTNHHRYEHNTRAKGGVPVPSQSAGSLPGETALNRHAYPSVPRPSAGTDTGALLDDFFREESVRRPPHRFPPLSEEILEDYEDYSDYPDRPYPELPPRKPSLGSRRHGQDLDQDALSVSQQLKNHPHHHSPLSSTSDYHKHKPTPASRKGAEGEVKGYSESQDKDDTSDKANIQEELTSYTDTYHHNPSSTLTDTYTPTTTTTTNNNENHHHHHNNNNKNNNNNNNNNNNQQPEQQQQQQQHSPDEQTTTKQCPQCHLREMDRMSRIESLKRQILDKLHFTTLPNRTGVPVPKALAHMTGIHADLLQDAPYGGTQHEYYSDEEDEEYTPPERVFTSAKPLPSHLKSGEGDSCYFTMPAEVYRSHVTKAFLWFYVRHTSDVKSNVIQMRVSRLGPPYSKKPQHSSKRVIWTHKAYSDKAFGWKRVEVTSVIRRWVKHASSNYGLEVVALNGDDNLVVRPPASAQLQGYEPTLDIKVERNVKRRYRRSDSLTCHDNSTEHRCCRYPLTISFAEFGWEWVIAPTHVKADYCAGECRMTLQNKTPYSLIASQTSDGGLCCTPSKMSALPLLYFDQQGDVVFQMLQSMRVERCGCF